MRAFTRSTATATALALVLAGAARAQPGQTPPTGVRLTLDEQALLDRGFISDGRHVGGGLAAVVLGFGTGQLIQGRWRETGWIFTLGEGAATVAFTVGLMGLIGCADTSSSTCHAGVPAVPLMVFAAVGGALFRVWGISDAFIGPSRHNQRLRALRARLGMSAPVDVRVMPYVARADDGTGSVGGVVFTF